MTIWSRLAKINFGVTFPLLAKIDVNGADADPLYRHLKKEASGIFGSSIKWNFTKFLVDRDGSVVKRLLAYNDAAQIREADSEAVGEGSRNPLIGCDSLSMRIDIHLLSADKAGAGDAKIIRELKREISRGGLREQDADADFCCFQYDLGGHAPAEGDDFIRDRAAMLKPIAEQFIERVMPPDIGPDSEQFCRRCIAPHCGLRLFSLNSPDPVAAAR